MLAILGLFPLTKDSQKVMTKKLLLHVLVTILPG